MDTSTHLQLLLDTCLLAGRMMTENGSEIYRVEDTMKRIAWSAGQEEAVSYVTATGLFMSFRHTGKTQLETINERKINLEKVVAVNHLSRKFAQKEISLEAFYAQLIVIEQKTPSFPFWLQFVCAGTVSASLMYLFGGQPHDLWLTFVAGSLGFWIAKIVKQWLEIRFLDSFFAACGVAFCAYLAVHFHWTNNPDSIIIGAIMPLVPGLAITNAFRDILLGHLISGIARATEAIFIAGSIGIGIALVFKLFF